MQAEPLSDELSKAIEDEKITYKMDSKERSKILAETFEWDKNEAMKIWCFGPETSGPNILTDKAQAATYLNEIRDSMEAAF